MSKELQIHRVHETSGIKTTLGPSSRIDDLESTNKVIQNSNTSGVMALPIQLSRRRGKGEPLFYNKNVHL